MCYQYNHRHGDYAHKRADYKKNDLPLVPIEQLQDTAYLPKPQFWVKREDVERRICDVRTRPWLLGWRDITGANLFRTTASSILPIAGVGDKFLLIFSSLPSTDLIILYANLNAFILDYISRQKVGGMSLKYFLMKQLAILPPSVGNLPAPWDRTCSLAEWVKPRVLELTYTACDLKPFAEDLGYPGDPFFWDDARRAVIRAELDTAFFHLYGISEADADYILDTFPIVKSKDEERFGTYHYSAGCGISCRMRGSGGTP